ncbi:MAG: response regulator [Xanthomonadales bacterium]|nr:response regulator [Xanthomonadales bacterium]
MKQGLTSSLVRAIEKDLSGFLWVGTIDGLYKFDGYQFTKISNPVGRKNIYIKSLLVDDENFLWVNTRENGLFRYKDLMWEEIKFSKSFVSNSVQVSSLELISGGIWLGTKDGVGIFSKENHEVVPLESIANKNVGSLSEYKKEVIIGADGKIIFLDLSNMNIETYTIPGNNEQVYIHDLTVYEDIVWIATSTGLERFDMNSKEFLIHFEELRDTRVKKIIENSGKIWVSTIDKGIFYIENNKIIYHFYYSNDRTSFSDQFIYTIYISDNLLWVGNFYNGLNVLDIKSLNFTYENNSKDSFYCSRSSKIYSFYPVNNAIMLFGTSDGLIEYDRLSGRCDRMSNNNNDIDLLVYDIKKFNQIFYISTSQGLYTLDSDSNILIESGFNRVTLFSYFDSGYLYLGTMNGLFKYDIKTQNYHKVNLTDKIGFLIYKKNSAGKHFFLTTEDLIYTLKDNNFTRLDIVNNSINGAITSFSFNNDELVVGTLNNGIYKFNTEFQLTSSNPLNYEVSVNSILSDQENKYWLGTNNGLLHMDFKKNKVIKYQDIAGLDTNVYLQNSALRTVDGEFFFGLSSGMVSFYPQDIKTHSAPPNIVLTEFKRFGKQVVPNLKQDDFLLEKSINELESLELTHKDYVIGFEFAALDFAAPEKNQYAYKLEGFDPDWTYVSADERTATYTNLPSGNYTFRVKGSNKDGVWNEEGKSLKVEVYPAPWLSWWAYTIYVFTFFALLSWYLHRKNKRNLMITNMLKEQVEERTSELQVQKQKVETLLVKKNEMFANVSHEFRTPLTLILGPVHKLLKSNLRYEDIKSLKMVNRNANRLLTMIEQLLLLARVSGSEKIVFKPQLVAHQVLSIYEIFKPLAEEKGIGFILKENRPLAINVVENTVDTILGNLVSNAIKYTPHGGKVTVSSYTNDGQAIIQVSDTGCGLDENQKNEIFNRFQRLDSHTNIDGVGLGLSVVEEMVKINNGTIKVESKKGVGSTFTVIFDEIDAQEVSETPENNNHRLVSQLARNSSLEFEKQQNDVFFLGNKKNDTILIIEDNDDMREHIKDTLKDHFYCIVTNRGKSGVALAIEYVPDIILCDVMMPEMDGFKVSRIIRSDSRTSHIPLVLLTALHEKQYRIKGWRENIDAYLTKPFDNQELILQLNNILTIRNLLKQKAKEHVKAGKNVDMASDLPKVDQNFINKLNKIIADNYKNSNLQRPQIASAMAVSTKQLQRKLKALIDKNPMDLLKEYRLTKAAELLKDGYQVSFVSDECGFNSLSHFSQVFKEQYGTPPKKYQQVTRTQT